MNWDAFNKNECLRHFVQSLTAAVSSYSNYYLLKLLFRMYYFSMTYCFALIRFNGQLKQQKTLTVTETIRVSASLVSAHILQALFFLIVKSLPWLLIQGTRCMMVFWLRPYYFSKFHWLIGLASQFISLMSLHNGCSYLSFIFF